MASLAVLGGAFLAAAVAGALAARVGVSVIPLYLLAGVAVGPHGLGVVGSVGGVPVPFVPADESLQLLAELGVVLLLFFLGVEFSVERLLARRRQMGVVGTVDLLVNFPVGVGLGLLLGWSVVESLLLGGVVYISSSAIITKSLLDLGWIANPESEPMLGTLVFEDLVVAVYLAVVTSLVLGGTDAGATARSVGVAVAFLLALVVAVYYGRGPFDRLLSAETGEGFVLRVLAVTVPVAALALVLGVSEAVAAFFVGMGVAGTGHVERVERLLAPVRDVFAAVFFLVIGLETDPRVVADVAVPLAAAVLLTAPAKVLTGYYSGRVYDLSPRRSVRVGLGMVTRGEFSLVVAATAAAGTTEVMTDVIPAFAVGYVLVMSLLGTVLMQYSAPFERVVAREDTRG
jgi:CPA2 family monovalent cation:H+ antiporter-2